MGTVAGLPGASSEKTVWYNAQNATTNVDLGTSTYPYNSDLFIYSGLLNASSAKVTVNLPAASSANAGSWFRVCNVGNSGGGAANPAVIVTALLNMQYSVPNFGSAATTTVTNQAANRCLRVVSSLAPNGSYFWVTTSNN